MIDNDGVSIFFDNPETGDSLLTFNTEFGNTTDFRRPIRGRAADAGFGNLETQDLSSATGEFDGEIRRNDGTSGVIDAYYRWAFQSIHSGRSMRYLDGEGLPPSGDAVLAEAFERDDFATAGFAYNALTSREWNYHRGFDEFHSVQEYEKEEAPSQKFADFVSERVDSDRLLSLLGRAYDAARPYLESQEGQYKQSVTDEDVIDDVLEWLKSVPEDKPYFLWVHLMDAHTPYSRWDNHLREIRGDTDIEHIIDPNNSDNITEGEEPEQAAIDAYDAGIRSADEQVGRILEVVGDDETVVITGDHGKEFGRFVAFTRCRFTLR